jgi:hypothetical protein
MMISDAFYKGIAEAIAPCPQQRAGAWTGTLGENLATESYELMSQGYVFVSIAIRIVATRPGPGVLPFPCSSDANREW